MLPPSLVTITFTSVVELWAQVSKVTFADVWKKTYAPLLQTQCYFRSFIESLNFCLIFVFLCRELQNWSHTIWSTNDIKVFDVDGSSNFIPACRGVFFATFLDSFLFLRAGQRQLWVGHLWFNHLPCAEMVAWVTRCTILP